MELSFKILMGIGLWLLLAACSNHTYEDLDPVDLETGGDEVSYQDVRSTFNTVCTACHSNPPVNGAPMALDSYQTVKSAVLNRGLLDRISRAEGEQGLMPLGGPRLPQTTIDLIFQWAENGLPEN